MTKKSNIGWARTTIDHLCLALVDCVNRTAPIVQSPTPYKMIRTSNVKSGFLDLSDVRYVTEETYKRWTRRQVPQRGDILLTREAPLGEVARVQNNDLIFLGQRIFSYRPDPAVVDSRFLFYSFRAPYVQQQIKSLGAGATVEHMRVPDAKKLVVSVPSLALQKCIGAILSAYDDLIEVNRRRVAILEEMARRLFEEWFVHLRFPGHEAISVHNTPDGPLPEGWTAATLGDLLRLEYGRALKVESRLPGSVPVIGSSGVIGWHNTSLTSGPCIVVGRKGNAGTVIWSSPACYPIDTTFYVRSSCPIRFVYQHLKRKRFLVGDTAVPGLNRDTAHRMATIIPPLKLMARFDQLVTPLDELADTLHQSVVSLAAARDLLLPRLISGELSVADAAVPARLLEAAE